MEELLAVIDETEGLVRTAAVGWEAARGTDRRSSPLFTLLRGRVVLRTSGVGGSRKFVRKGSKVSHLGIASLFAMLLHWVQPLPM
jgi:hypothetical protein